MLIKKLQNRKFLEILILMFFLFLFFILIVFVVKFTRYTGVKERDIPIIVAEDVNEVDSLNKKKEPKEDKLSEAVYDYITGNNDRKFEDIINSIDNKEKKQKPKKNKKKKTNRKVQSNKYVKAKKNAKVASKSKWTQKKSNNKGLHMIQVGAFSSIPLAKNAKNNILAAYKVDLAQDKYIIEQILPTKKQKKIFYRLLIGPFPSVKLAQKFCNKIKANKGTCFYKLKK